MTIEILYWNFEYAQECAVCKRVMRKCRWVKATEKLCMKVCDTCLRELHDEVCRLIDEEKI